MRRALPLLSLAAAIIVTACTSRAGAQQVSVEAGLDRTVLHADKKQPAYLRVGLKGFSIDGRGKRAQMNVAIVIDKSRSMAGGKISQAKAAARAALDALDGNDIVSIIAYDSTVQVLVPATKVSDRRTIQQGIDRLSAGGMTALFAGTSKGAAEVRKFLSDKRVNRVVLLSDGQANVGPATAGDLARLGRSLRGDGIGVTTIGLGLDYNEDVLVALAKKSGGNHVFVEDARKLAGLFRQGFGGLTKVVAKEVMVTVTFGEGIRPVRALGIDADIIGQKLTAELSQLYSREEDELLIEIETRPMSVSSVTTADIEVRYHNVVTDVVDTITTSVAARLSDNPREVEASVDREVMITVVERLANERNRFAINLRDKGKIDEARQVLQDNERYLSTNAERWSSPYLKDLGRHNDDDARNLKGEAWNRQRKLMRQRNYAPPKHDNLNF